MLPTVMVMGSNLQEEWAPVRVFFQVALVMMFCQGIIKVTKTKLELRISMKTFCVEKQRQDCELCYTTQYNETTENQRKHKIK